MANLPSSAVRSLGRLRACATDSERITPYLELGYDRNRPNRNWQAPYAVTMRGPQVPMWEA